MAYGAIQEGAVGVDMGHNIFQSASPEAMIQAVISVVHGGLKPNEALDLYRDAAGRERADSKPGIPASR